MAGWLGSCGKYAERPNREIDRLLKSVIYRFGQCPRRWSDGAYPAIRNTGRSVALVVRLASGANMGWAYSFFKARKAETYSEKALP